MAFTRGFDQYACVGDEINCDVGEFQITARLMQDSCSHIDDDDCHNLKYVDDNQRDKVIAARQAWEDDEWFYCGVVLSVSKNGVVLDDHAAALWAIEVNYPGSDNGYLTVVANDLIGEATEAGERTLERLA